MALLRSENSAGYKSHAVGSSDNSNGYVTASGSNRRSYRAYESQVSSDARSAAYPPVATNRFSSSRTTATAGPDLHTSGYTARTDSSADRYAIKGSTSSRNYSSRNLDSSRLNGTTASHSYGSNSSSRSYSQSSRSSQTDRSSRSVRTAVSDAAPFVRLLQIQRGFHGLVRQQKCKKEKITERDNTRSGPIISAATRTMETSCPFLFFMNID